MINIKTTSWAPEACCDFIVEGTVGDIRRLASYCRLEFYGLFECNTKDMSNVPDKVLSIHMRFRCNVSLKSFKDMATLSKLNQCDHQFQNGDDACHSCSS